MSFSRFAAIGASLVAGVTLASCASSSAPIPGTGPNQSVINFPGGSARVHFIMGSPQLNLGVNNADLYIDNQLAFPNFFYAGCQGPSAAGPCAVVPLAAISPATSGPVLTGPATPYIELPIGVHDFKLVQHGTLAPAFLDQTIKLTSGQKLAIVAEGDAGYHTTTWAVFVEPVYQTPVGIRASSVFNASPNAGTSDFWYNCPSVACTDGVHSGTLLAGGLTVGNS
ncbi:MAG TPA: hypothetical protein VGX02_08890, partial [Candidatus Eremiobacteraceae bacterium]|nr:hypothetical protein [Candidatus Eremiobacteraceae bacterium]